MARKHANTAEKAGTTSRPNCPKCGKKMTKGSFAPSGRRRWECKKGFGRDSKKEYCYVTTNPDSKFAFDRGGRPKDSGPVIFSRKLGGAKRFVVTSAQNATPIHVGFFRSLLAYCKHNDAELVVIPIRYKNPTSRWTESQSNLETWAPELTPYLYNQRKKLNDNLILLGDIKVHPTADRPLSGFEAITSNESGILGHPKIELRTIATPQGKLPKIMTTTGSVTIKNYTDSKAGKKGEFHHVFGACVVDIKGKIFHMRQINAIESGAFIDLDHEYLPDGRVGEAAPALALIMGDTHVRFADPMVLKATFGKGGIVEKINPQVLVWHDLLDGYSCNPHTVNDPFIQVAKHKHDFHLVRKEVEESVEFLRAHSRGRRAYVVHSNHNDFFRRWMMNTDWRREPDNAQFYLHTALMMVESAKMVSYGAEYSDPFIYWVNQNLSVDDDIRCLLPDESCMIGPIECGFHGNYGPNGVRGTVLNLGKIGVRLISGHGHSPAIEDGHYRTGTSTFLRLDYVHGPSSWLNTHAVIYANGKRTLMNIIEGAAFL
jgi:hypothetical protein